MPEKTRPQRIWPSLVAEAVVTAAAIWFLHGLYRPLAAAAGIVGLGSLLRARARQRRHL